jgi:hypothetical protein
MVKAARDLLNESHSRHFLKSGCQRLATWVSVHGRCINQGLSRRQAVLVRKDNRTERHLGVDRD